MTKRGGVPRLVLDIRKSGCGLARTIIGEEQRLDRLAEYVGDLESEGQARVIAAGLDRIDGLAGHVQPVGQVGLAPPSYGAPLAQTVSQRPRFVLRPRAVTHATTPAPTVTDRDALA